ncbi:hypothetical protein BDZ91DRAFT_485994 [Kalaharituber pfeilii]|nr:hypothetical protein BDZ91DRAFT_485994 [Kalaharituber pfeilii]
MKSAGADRCNAGLYCKGSNSSISRTQHKHAYFNRVRITALRPGSIHGMHVMYINLIAKVQYGPCPAP